MLMAVIFGLLTCEKMPGCLRTHTHQPRRSDNKDHDGHTRAFSRQPAVVCSHMIYLDYKTVRYTTKILNYVTETHDHNRHVRHSRRHKTSSTHRMRTVGTQAMRHVMSAFIMPIPRLSSMTACATRIHPDKHCLLYTSPSPRDKRQARMPSSA